MPYSPEHKAQVRKQIVEHARVLFNRDGFSDVTIDQIMAGVGLTRGGFYNHFRNKEELYAEAVESFLNGRGQQWRDEAGVRPEMDGSEIIQAMINSYLSAQHLTDVDGQCPMIALPSDVARSTAQVRSSYQVLLQSMVTMFEINLPEEISEKHRTALALAAICVGGMVLSRTIDDPSLADEIRTASYGFAVKSAGLTG